MFAHVHVMVGLAEEGATTDVTEEPAALGVYWHVGSQVAGLGETSATNIASERMIH